MAEPPPPVWSFTREALIAALTRIEARPVLLPGRDKSVVVAEWMADAIIEALEDGEIAAREGAGDG